VEKGGCPKASDHLAILGMSDDAAVAEAVTVATEAEAVIDTADVIDTAVAAVETDIGAEGKPDTNLTARTQTWIQKHINVPCL